MKLLIFFLLFSFGVNGKVILIDPGHGGEDLGASNSMVHEKELVLSFSKRIHRLLSQKHSSYLTRSVDRTLHLDERAKLAEKVKADLFISVHVNASTRSSSNGIETFYLSNHRDTVIAKLEKIENKTLSGKELVIDQILTDVIIKKTTKSSRKLAEAIHKEVKRSVIRPFKMKDRGIKPGLFHVLTLAKRPAVLLEVGFLSNKKELKTIASDRFQEAYAKAVVKGIDRYLKSLKK